MINFEEIFERIKHATKTRTQVELAEVLDIRQSSISDAKRRNSVPSDWYIKLFEQFGLNPDWLKKGSGPMYLRTPEGAYSPVEGPTGPATVNEEPARYGNQDAKNTVVSVYNTAPLPAGTEQATPVSRLSIPQSFAVPGTLVVQADSAGMEPTILKNAFVGVETNKRTIASGEVYAVRLPHEGVVFKRLYMDSQKNCVALRSDNPTHPELTLPLDKYDEHILGRVAWVLQRM
ncbi:helix-turn-helix domain-containing protein [Desulfovibrio sp. OttesenSCG-928-G15]|nr:helix-turn-helix domain-containing protein [Desulfovibrio sp. OttesenSCG-928-G15]